MCDWLVAQDTRLDYCVVGEPTSASRLGDTIKNGRRGTLTGKLRIRGVQGHIAYPQLAKNPIHLAAPLLAELIAVEWDRGNAHFPPTSWQISNIHAGTGAGNVIPGEIVVDFNFRFSSESTPASLRERLEAIVARHGVDHEIAWTLGGETFLTAPGALSTALAEAIRDADRPRRPSSRPPAAPPTAASSPASARRSSSSGRSTPASTRSTSTSRSPASTC